MDAILSYYSVSVFCYMLNRRLHLKLAAYSAQDAIYLSTAINSGAVVFEIPEPSTVDNHKLIAYMRGDIYVFGA